MIDHPHSVARKLPLNDPDFIGYLRIAYVVSQVGALLVYYFITMKVSLVTFWKPDRRDLTLADPKKERPIGSQICQPAFCYGEQIASTRSIASAK
jgi:hypothetical protein